MLFYLLFQLHIICYPALGPQGCYYTDWIDWSHVWRGLPLCQF